jgi:hypothetical protein
MHRPSALPVLVLLAAFAAAPALAHNHAAPQPAPASSPVAKYPAEAALRTAMDRVRNAVEAFEHARHGHMGAEQVRALADHLDAQVARVFKECRLEPQADASLHVLLGTLMKGSRAMRQTPTDYAPVAAMERAMADYARMFDDPAARAAAAR